MASAKARCISASVSFATLLFAAADAWPADAPKLVAPVYPGAVPAVPAAGVKTDASLIGSFGGVKGLDCSGATRVGVSSGPWCFLSRDPIDKVKAFYDKAVSPMRAIKGTYKGNGPVQGHIAYAEREWVVGVDQAPGFEYAAVSLHALPPPGAPGRVANNTEDSWGGQETYKFYSSSRHFNGFLDAVDWFGDPSKRKPAELNAFYEKHKRLESALFQRKGPKLEPVDETLRARYTAQQEQARQKAMGMMPGMGQLGQMPPAMPANQYATPEDSEFNAFMQKNPKVANRYAELSKKLGTLMQQGRFDEADAVDIELQALIDANPELAALDRRADERSAAIGASAQARENRAVANYHGGMDKAVWDPWVEYIKAAEKEAYYTLIVVDRALSGTGKDYSRDQALIAKDVAGWVAHQQVWEFAYAPQQGTQALMPAASGEREQTTPSFAEDPAGAVGDAMKKGLKGLKGLF